ncbi:hypothetical protein QBC32DRAFT_345617 [Pseudoneurospora amorphoporcata]|uniref:Uncharacterized protein n=1 Tax=Pseudoneurospora amorphoporcata TaxID=241081 RepID=A0AAN6SEK5_9PEZI|nr:hypothetical protein QBC32DRAFT_345617 [Pseudoneurospora amorphoporcata]
MAPTPSTLIAKSLSSSSEALANILPRYYHTNRRRLSRGALIGVIVAIVVVCIVLVFLSVLFRRRRVRRSRQNMHQNMQQAMAAPGGWAHSSSQNQPLPQNPYEHHAQNRNGLNPPAGGWVQPGTYQPPPYQPEPVHKQGGNFPVVHRWAV